MRQLMLKLSRFPAVSMLGNKDFAQMVSSGAVGGGGKVKFDLKQVSKWDRENEKSMFKKKLQPEGQFKEKEKRDDWTTLGYRDRAEERRKGLNSEDDKMDESVSKLDTEKTHILGGDLDHTHLVRGLDRSLLNKVREDLELQNAVSSVAEVSAPVATQPKALYVPISTGARIPGINVSLPPAAGKEVVELKNTKKIAEEYAVSKKKRKEREPDSSVHSSVGTVAAPVPAVKKAVPTNFSIYDDVVEKYVPEGAIDESTGEVLKTESHSSAAGTSSGGRVGSSLFSTKTTFAPSAVPPPPPPPAAASSSSFSVSGGSGVQQNSAVSSMFAGIYDTSKVGATNSWSSSTVTAAPSNSSSSSSAGYSAFSKPSAVPAARVDEPPNPLEASNDDLMKPVMALLHAQANKEKAAQDKLHASLSNPTASSSAMARNNKIVIETDEQGRQLVHRDVFATTLDKVVKGTTIVGLNGKEGEMFGLHGTYEDVFPESAEYEVFSDDEGDGEAPTKKPTSGGADSSSGGDRGGGSLRAGSTAFSATVGLEGSIKKNIIKNSVTPWSRGHGKSNSSGGGGGGAPSGSKTASRPMQSGSTAAGLNRAARRAAGL